MDSDPTAGGGDEIDMMNNLLAQISSLSEQQKVALLGEISSPTSELDQHCKRLMTDMQRQVRDLFVDFFGTRSPPPPCLRFLICTDFDACRLRRIPVPNFLVLLRQIPGIGPMIKSAEIKSKGNVIFIHVYTEGQKRAVAQCSEALQLALWTENLRRLPDAYYVRVKNFNFTQNQVMETSRRARWAAANNFKSLSDARLKFGILYLTFSDLVEARGACQMSPCLDGQVVTCVPFDIRALPCFCSNCTAPGHLEAACKARPRCGHCPGNHHSRECPTPWGKFCQNCAEEMADNRRMQRQAMARNELPRNTPPYTRPVDHEPWSPKCQCTATRKMRDNCYRLLDQTPQGFLARNDSPVESGDTEAEIQKKVNLAHKWVADCRRDEVKFAKSQMAVVSASVNSRLEGDPRAGEKERAFQSKVVEETTNLFTQQNAAGNSQPIDPESFEEHVRNPMAFPNQGVRQAANVSWDCAIQMATKSVVQGPKEMQEEREQVKDAIQLPIQDKMQEFLRNASAAHDTGEGVGMIGDVDDQDNPDNQDHDMGGTTEPAAAPQRPGASSDAIPEPAPPNNSQLAGAQRAADETTPQKGAGKQNHKGDGIATEAAAPEASKKSERPRKHKDGATQARAGTSASPKTKGRPGKQKAPEGKATQPGDTRPDTIHPQAGTSPSSKKGRPGRRKATKGKAAGEKPAGDSTSTGSPSHPAAASGTPPRARSPNRPIDSTHGSRATTPAPNRSPVGTPAPGSPSKRRRPSHDSPPIPGVGSPSKRQRPAPDHPSFAALKLSCGPNDEPPKPRRTAPRTTLPKKPEKRKQQNPGQTNNLDRWVTALASTIVSASGSQCPTVTRSDFRGSFKDLAAANPFPREASAHNSSAHYGFAQGGSMSVQDAPSQDAPSQEVPSQDASVSANHNNDPDMGDYFNPTDFSGIESRENDL